MIHPAPNPAGSVPVLPHGSFDGNPDSNHADAVCV
jgi:hypothetical protein